MSFHEIADRMSEARKMQRVHLLDRMDRNMGELERAVARYRAGLLDLRETIERRHADCFQDLGVCWDAESEMEAGELCIRECLERINLYWAEIKMRMARSRVFSCGCGPL
jgi:hypothetical protein